MAASRAKIKHQFTSAKADGGDASLVRPSNWNADHDGFLIAVKSADEEVAASTTLQDDNDLVFAIGASEVWLARYALHVDTWTGSGDFKVALSVPTSATGRMGIHAPTLAVSDALNTSITALSVAIPNSASIGTLQGDALVIVEATIFNSTNAGNVTLQWAQDTANGTTRMFAGSQLVALRQA